MPPPGVLTSTLSPTFLPISARAVGEETDTLPVFTSASVSPTIWNVFSLLGVLVDQRHRRAELDRRAGQLGDVDHLGALQHVLELDDAALVVRLRLLGRMIFGVFREVAVGARLGDRLDDARALDLLAMRELRLQRRVARDR